MSEELGSLYRSYVGYMSRMNEDLDEPGDDGRPRVAEAFRPRQLDFEEFCEFWRCIRHEPCLEAQWLRRLTLGYEGEKKELEQALLAAFAPRPDRRRAA